MFLKYQTLKYYFTSMISCFWKLFKWKSEEKPYPTVATRKKEKDRENKLINEIQNLEENMCNSSQALENIEIKKRELESIRSKKLQGSILRSKIQWITEDE